MVYCCCPDTGCEKAAEDGGFCCFGEDVGHGVEEMEMMGMESV